MTTAIPRGNIVKMFAIGPTLTSVAVATITTAEQSYTVNGLQVGDIVAAVNRPNNTPVGVGVVNARVSAANTLSLTWVNPTAGSVTPGAGVFSIIIARPEIGGGTLPTVFNA
jgi:hypothetical protein